MKLRQSKSSPDENSHDKVHTELQRLRSEIQDTIEELQSFGEQLKEANSA